MRWAVFAVCAYLALTIDRGLIGVLEVWQLRPSVMMILGMFIALWASRPAALGAAIILGLLVDLTNPVSLPPGQPLVLVGPHVLGFLLATLLTLEMRAIVMRRQPFAIGFMALQFSVAISIVVVSVHAVRGWYEPEFATWSATAELLRRLGTSTYTGLLAVLVGWFLTKTIRMWGFPVHAASRTGWR